jgi:transcriptional regulator with XRE-family HTH domain
VFTLKQRYSILFGMQTEFINWLIEEMKKRGWNNSELARRAGVVPSTVSMVLSEQQRPGLEFCTGVAQALNMPPDKILRLAGLLPPLPPSVEEEQELISIFRSVPANARIIVMQMLRGLKDQALGELDAISPEEAAELRQYEEKIRSRHRRKVNTDDGS